MKRSVFIGLGSNIEQPELQLRKAIEALDALAGTKVLADSGYFTSKPMGPSDQPDYVNAAVEIETSLTAAELLNHCQLIEKEQGRIKTRHWGERSIDLDILLYADEQIEQPDLTVPHPGICQRDFVYMPLLKLKADIVIPGKGMLKNMVSDKEQAMDYSCTFAGNIAR